MSVRLFVCMCMWEWDCMRERLKYYITKIIVVSK